MVNEFEGLYIIYNLGRSFGVLKELVDGQEGLDLTRITTRSTFITIPNILHGIITGANRTSGASVYRVKFFGIDGEVLLSATNPRFSFLNIRRDTHYDSVNKMYYLGTVRLLELGSYRNKYVMSYVFNCSGSSIENKIINFDEGGKSFDELKSFNAQTEILRIHGQRTY